MTDEKDQEKHRERRLSRRDFFRLAWGSAASQAGETLARSVEDIEEFLPVPRRPGFMGRVKVGSAAELEVLPVGTMVATFAPTEGFYLSRVVEGWLALHARCTHLGCRIVWEGEAADSPGNSGCFDCPTDGSIYDRYGERVDGPATYPLALLLLERKGLNVFVRTDAIQPRVMVNKETDPTLL